MPGSWFVIQVRDRSMGRANTGLTSRKLCSEAGTMLSPYTGTKKYQVLEAKFFYHVAVNLHFLVLPHKAETGHEKYSC